MPELIDVVDANGNQSRVSEAWLTRWPKDFKPVKGAKKTTPVVEDSPAGDKKED